MKSTIIIVLCLILLGPIGVIAIIFYCLSTFKRTKTIGFLSLSEIVLIPLTIIISVFGNNLLYQKYDTFPVTEYEILSPYEIRDKKSTEYALDSIIPKLETQDKCVYSTLKDYF